jgi:chromosome segregation ATPase
MAQTAETVLSIKVDSSQAVQSIVEYQRKIEQIRAVEADLKKQIKESGDATGELSRKLVQFGEERKAYSRIVSEQSKAVQNNIKIQTKEADSLNQLRARLSNLTKQYDEMSKAQRESAEGLKLKDEINDITKALKGGEEGTQRFYRNVGNYAGSLQGLFSNLQGTATQAIPGIQSLGLAANASFGGILTVVGAVINILRWFAKAMTSSEELTMAMNEAFAFLKASGVQLQRSMQSLGKYLLDMWQKVSKFVGAVANGIAKIIGKEEEWAKYKEERFALQNELTKQQKEENRLTLEQRKINEQNAQSELKISKLKAEVADKANLTAQERIKLLKEAADEEEAISKRNYEQARREYELQKRKSALAGNSAEENEALSEALIKMTNAQTAYNNKVRELRGQISEATMQAIAEEKKLYEERKKNEMEVLASLDALIDEQLKDAEKAGQQLADDYIQSYKNRVAEAALEGKSTAALLVEQRQAELDMLHQMEEESDEAFRGRQLAAQQAYNDAVKALAEEEYQTQKAKWEALGGVMQSLSGLIEEFGAESKAAAVAAKAMALGEIAVKTGVAIAGGVAQAQSVPFPANLIAIATTVATVLANIAAATKMVKSAKFATGGYVSGAGSGTSDSIPAQLSNGESVNNARSTAMFAPIYSSLNQMGGGIPIVAAQSASQVQGEDMLARAFAKGLQALDLRVGVDEIARVQNRVRVVENLGDL